MTRKVVDKLLPTTMVGSYPRPHWFKHQLLGRDVRVAFKEVQHEEAYTDAVATVINDQETAGLDIVTDGNMWYDDYVGVIGSFCWYLYERIPGFEPTRNPHPSMVNAGPSVGKTILDDWGGVINNGPVDKAGHALRWTDLFQVAQTHAHKPVKVSIGVTKTDEIYLDAKPVTPTELTAHLQGLVHDSKKVDVAIAGDEGTSYKNIVKVMDLVRAAGISSVALATNPTT